MNLERIQMLSTDRGSKFNKHLLDEVLEAFNILRLFSKLGIFLIIEFGEKMMKITAISYGNKPYRKAMKLNLKTALSKGKVDEALGFSDKDIDKEFMEENQHILCSKKGNGYWLWKVYFCIKVLDELSDGDYMVYADAGGYYYTNSVREVVNYMGEKKLWLVYYDQPWIEKHYTKRDAFVLMDCDDVNYTESTQCHSGLFVMKKCREAEAFLNEWLKFAKDDRILTDLPNKCGKENYEGFLEHRHDQSIFSLLCKKHCIRAINQIDNYEKYQFTQYHHSRFGHVLTIKIFRSELILKLRRKVKKIIKK